MKVEVGRARIAMMGRMTATGGTPDARIIANAAWSWFADAKREAQPSASSDAKRCQIVAAVAFAETSLSERIRDEVLKPMYSELDKYFPVGSTRRVLVKWQTVPARLLQDGRIAATSDSRRSAAWNQLEKLVPFRSSLLRGGVSRRISTAESVASHPLPSGEQLALLVHD